MSVATLTPPAPAQAAPATPAPEWARALLERQLWILGQLAEGGLEIARAIERQATGEGSEAGARQAVDAHIPMAYARVARAVRMTILLQSKLIGELQSLETKAAAAAADANCLRGTRRVGQVHDQKRRLGRIVGRIAWADGQDAERAQRLAREAVERLEQDELYGDILTRPVSELVTRLCADMGLAPDWPALAEEAWAKAEMEVGGAGGPWAGVRVQNVSDMRPPPRAGEGDREAVEGACQWQSASAEPSTQPHAPLFVGRLVLSGCLPGRPPDVAAPGGLSAEGPSPP